jgi:tRNA 2-thiouridine synthesizing protein A
MANQFELDARGLNCPLPLLKLKQQLNIMGLGDQITVKTTDSGSVRDFAAFTAQVGHILLQQSERNGEYLFVIEKRV